MEKQKQNEGSPSYIVKNAYGVAGRTTHRTPEAALKAAAKREGMGWVVEDTDGNQWNMLGDRAVCSPKDPEY